MRVPILALLGLLVVAAPARATVITFDDGVVTNVIGSFYAPLGVTFSGATWQTNFGLVGFSGPYGLGSSTATPFNWTSAAPVVAAFNQAMAFASIRVLDLGENGFTLNAYDALVGGNLVDSTTVFGVGLGNNNFQTLSVSGPSILRVEMFQAQSISIDGVVLENFQFDPPAAPVPEPGSLLLFGLGLVSAGVMRCRRAGRPRVA